MRLPTNISLSSMEEVLSQSWIEFQNGKRYPWRVSLQVEHNTVYR